MRPLHAHNVDRNVHTGDVHQPVVHIVDKHQVGIRIVDYTTFLWGTPNCRSTEYKLKLVEFVLLCLKFKSIVAFALMVSN